jgi:hypothetical protein
MHSCSSSDTLPSTHARELVFGNQDIADSCVITLCVWPPRVVVGPNDDGIAPVEFAITVQRAEECEEDRPST